MVCASTYIHVYRLHSQQSPLSVRPNEQPGVRSVCAMGMYSCDCEASALFFDFGDTYTAAIV